MRAVSVRGAHEVLAQGTTMEELLANLETTVKARREQEQAAQVAAARGGGGGGVGPAAGKSMFTGGFVVHVETFNKTLSVDDKTVCMRNQRPGSDGVVRLHPLFPL